MNDTFYEFLEDLDHYLDWEYDAPDWAKWFAVNKDGYAYYFKEKPIPGVEEWIARDGDGCIPKPACILPESCHLREHWDKCILALSDRVDTPKRTPRRGAHIWKAWADGKTVQIKIYRHDPLSLDEPEFIWVDDDPRNWDTCGPDDEPENWRIKPHKRQLRVRIAVIKMPAPMKGRKEYMTQTAYDRDQERMIQSDPDFYAWATDWIEVAVPND